MGNLGQAQLCSGFVLIRSDSVSIFQQSFEKTMEIIAVIQYILTSAQSFGSQDYCNKSLMMILGLLVYYSVKISRQR